jgi:hypothetical protein
VQYAPAGLKAGVILKDRFDFVFPGLFFFVSWLLFLYHLQPFTGLEPAKTTL